MTLTINIPVVVVVVVVVVVIGRFPFQRFFLNPTMMVSHNCSVPQVVYQDLVNTVYYHQYLKISGRERIIFMKVCNLTKIKAHIPSVAVHTFKSQIIDQTYN